MATSVYGQILEDTQTRVQDINLSGIADANIVIQHVADERDKYFPALPGVIITPIGDRFLTGLDDGGTNEREALQYRTMIATLQSTSQQQGVSIDAHLLWRQQIRRALNFQYCTITGTNNTFLRSQLEFGPVFDARSWLDKSMIVSVLFRTVDVREGRSNA